MMSLARNAPLAVIGLGYVGLPLAVAFGKVRPVIGFDICTARIASLQDGIDRTLEVDCEELEAAGQLVFSSCPEQLKSAEIFIVTVPTPVDDARRPDVSALVSASRTVAQAMKPGNIVIYESTVYPGCTEEVCVPVLEQVSGMTYNRDFFLRLQPRTDQSR
jgi:UDP-N-acetyl-D-galactosamine dehydrogenase